MRRTEQRVGIGIGRLGGAWAAAIVVVAAWPAASAAQAPAPQEPAATSLQGWHYRLDVSPPAAKPENTPWHDLVLSPPVFDAARTDLADLRLFDAAGREVPYDLRVLRPDYRIDSITAKEFNRARGPNGSAEVTLDLSSTSVEHNEVEVDLPRSQYRRRARLDGSPDGQDWRLLVEKDLFRFELGAKSLEDRRLSYPPSRFRFLRVRVEPDPVVDKPLELEVSSVKVLRRVEVPGEPRTLSGKLGPREPVRTDDGPGSAWVIDLGGASVPCERITCEVADPEFVRNYRIESAGPPDSEPPFQPISQSVWRRAAGDASKPLVAEFSEVLASRLRLVVTDASNPPLNLRSVSFTAPARQVVFPRPEANATGPLRLYAGNPRAYAPRYDFARNLPPRLDPAPARRSLGPREENPDYVPEPKPWTDRWPGLIYVVLGTVAAVLGLIILDLARQAIARHDADPLAASSPSPSPP